MPYKSATLNSTEYGLVRGNHWASIYVVANPNNVMLRGKVGNITLPASFAQIQYQFVDVGSYSAVKEGFTVYISKTESIRDAYWRGRVRKTPTVSGVLDINQTSARFDYDDYVIVVKDVAIHEKLPRDVSGTVYVDYDVTWNGLRPIISGLQSAYAQIMSAGVGGFAAVALSPSALATAHGATISTWAWDADGGTFQTGSASTQAVTLRYTEAGVYWPRVTVTDSAGRSNWFTMQVCILPADLSTGIMLGVTNVQIDGAAEGGWSASITTQTEAQTALLGDQTQVVLFVVERYGASALSITTNVRFVGRVRSESTSMTVGRNGLVSQTSLTLDGYGSIAGRTILPTIALYNKDAASLSNINRLTIWRAQAFIATELSTLSNVVAIEWDETGLAYEIDRIGTADNRSLMDSLDEMATAITRRSTWWASGELLFAPHTNYQLDPVRDALPTVAMWTSADWVKQLSIQREQVERVGKVTAYGGSYNPSDGKTTAARATAPAQVWGSGEGRSQANAQVLQANLGLSQILTDISLRAAAHYADKNPSWQASVEHSSGYQWLQPSVSRRYILIVSSSDNERGVAFEEMGRVRWYLRSVSLSFDLQTETCQVKCGYAQEVIIGEAQTEAAIEVDDGGVLLPVMPPLADFPFAWDSSINYPDGTLPTEDEAPIYGPQDGDAVSPPGSSRPSEDSPPAERPEVKNGEVVLWGNSASVWVAQDFGRSSSPTWRNVTPPISGGHAVQQAIFDPHGAGGWVLTHDGTNSIVWRTSNILASDPTWTASPALDGEFTAIRATSTQGEVMIYGINDEATSFSFFATAQPPETVTTAAIPDGTYTIRVSGTYEMRTEGPSAKGDFFYYTDDNWGSLIYTQFPSGWRLNETWPVLPVPAYDPTHIYEFTFTVSGGGGLRAYIVDPGIANNDGGVTIEVFTDQSAVVARSTNGGATWTVTATEGALPPAGAGFDTQAVGNQVYAATGGMVRVASAGGAFADEANGGTTGTSAAAIWAYGQGSNAYLLASIAAISGETLWKISGTKTNITPIQSGNAGVVVSQGALTMRKDTDALIWAVVNVAGQLRLARSTDGGLSWSFTTVAQSARWVRAKAERVYVVHADAIQFSTDEGASVSTVTAPGTSGKFLEVR